MGSWKGSWGLLLQESLVSAKIEKTSVDFIIVWYEKVWYECLDDDSYQGSRGAVGVVIYFYLFILYLLLTTIWY